MIPVVDVFAGPGGLAEGFGSIDNNNGSAYLTFLYQSSATEMHIKHFYCDLF